VKALILCAGYGTRLGGLTRDIPKPMLSICDKPLLAYTIQYLADQGFKNIAINLHFKPEIIKKYFDNGQAWGVDIHYSYEETLLGTAGAVKALESFFSDVEDFLVIYGDLLIDQDLQGMLKLHKDKKAAATILIHQRKKSNSLIQLGDDGRIEDFVERPSPEEIQKLEGSHSWVNSGVQFLNRRILKYIPKDRSCDLPRDIYPSILNKESIYGFPLSGYRCAIDSPERYEQARRAVVEKLYVSPNFR
jgi:NDP-sugar pyrophosphorylase family protein